MWDVWTGSFPRWITFSSSTTCAQWWWSECIPRPIHISWELCVLNEFTSIDFFLHFFSGHKVVIWKWEKLTEISSLEGKLDGQRYAWVLRANTPENLSENLQTTLADSRYLPSNQHIQHSLSTPTDQTSAPMLLEHCEARHAAVHSSSCSLPPPHPPACTVRNSPAILERVTGGLPRPVIWKHLWLQSRTGKDRERHKRED